MSDIAGVKCDSRAEGIACWLSQSALARQFKKGEGFFVNKGAQVRLADGETVDLFNWLAEEGIAGGSVVAGYSIGYSGRESEYGERLSFFKVVVDAPFSRLLSEALPEPSEEDIPF